MDFIVLVWPVELLIVLPGINTVDNIAWWSEMNGIELSTVIDRYMDRFNFVHANVLQLTL